MLPRYGFEGSPKAVAAIAPWQSHFCSLQGVFDMLQQFDRPEITSNAEFQQQACLVVSRQAKDIFTWMFGLMSPLPD